MKNIYFLVIIMAVLVSCRDASDDTLSGTPTLPVAPLKGDTTTNPLSLLPKDTGGTTSEKGLGSDPSPFGYLLYTPSGYSSAGPSFPLLIFLHGTGEIGNSSTDANELQTIAIYGPPLLIRTGKWSPKYPMVVASPQCHDTWWDYNKVKQFIEFMMSHYRVDTTRIYITGLSMGGYGTYDQLTAFGKASHLAAAVPISGSGTLSSTGIVNASQVPLWSFHGEVDTIVSVDFDKNIHTAIHASYPGATAKLTLYPKTGHDCWTETYDDSGMGKEDPAFDPFAMDVFNWMLQYKRD